MGMRPRGLGLRLKSRQFQNEVVVTGCGGARWPFGIALVPFVVPLADPLADPFVDPLGAFSCSLIDWFEVFGVMRGTAIGERLLVRDLRSSAAL